MIFVNVMNDNCNVNATSPDLCPPDAPCVQGEDDADDYVAPGGAHGIQ